MVRPIRISIFFDCICVLARLSCFFNSSHGDAICVDPDLERWKRGTRKLRWQKVAWWPEANLCRLGIGIPNFLSALGLPSTEGTHVAVAGVVLNPGEVAATESLIPILIISRRGYRFLATLLSIDGGCWEYWAQDNVLQCRLEENFRIHPTANLEGGALGELDEITGTQHWSRIRCISQGGV